jgi:hypothetical protein
LSTTSQYSPLVVVDESSADRPVQRLERLPLGSLGDGRFDEAWLQRLVFDAPGVLPISEIDPSFGPLTPLCRELGTRAGSVDVVFANPDGLLTLVECKLWRNPQARREVVGQILDYAKELGRWDYGDLQREVSKSAKVSGNSPYLAVQGHHPHLDEARFVDDVSRERGAEYLKQFWTDLVATLRLDDAEQKPPKPTAKPNLYLVLGRRTWISAFFSKSKGQIGVYLTFERGLRRCSLRAVARDDLRPSFAACLLAFSST